MLGGRRNKWLRRFIAPLFQETSTNICSTIMGIWNAWLLITYVLVAIGLSFGYGGDTLGKKAIRRTIYCIANLAVGGLFIWLYGPKMFWVFIPNAGVAAWSIYMGIKNPIYAAAEEVFVCALLYLMTGAYPFVPLIIK
jgi:hypothetical protein